jgi:serine/threonine protein kinase
MGEVYLARDEKLNHNVAIKVLPSSLLQDQDRLRRFEQEAQAAGALNHPNILAVYDVGTHDGSPYIVSELLEGEELREQLNLAAMSRSRSCPRLFQRTRNVCAASNKKRKPPAHSIIRTFWSSFTSARMKARLT